MDAIYPLYNYPTEGFHYRDPDPEIDLLTTPWDYIEEWDEGDDKLEEDWMEEEEKEEAVEEADDWWMELLVDRDEAYF